MSKLTHVVAGRIPFLADFGTEGLRSSLAMCPRLHRVCFNIGLSIWQLPLSEQARRAREKTGCVGGVEREKDGSHSFCNAIVEGTCHHFCCTLFIRRELGLTHTQRQGMAQRDNWEPFQKLLTSCSKYLHIKTYCPVIYCIPFISPFYYG